MNKILVSSAILPKSIQHDFTDYTVIPQVVKQLDVDGIELVFLPEWDSDHPPLTPTSANWNTTPKINEHNLVNYILSHNINVPSIHLNRDIGNLLCSKDPNQIEIGQKILDQNLKACDLINADIAVLHLWDTYLQNINLTELFKRVYEVSQTYSVRLTIENIPISNQTINSEQAWSLLSEMMPKHYGFTLDLNWCSLYNNYHELIKYFDSIYNVHVQGFINQDKQLIPRVGNLNLLACLENLKELNYNKYVTLEMNRVNDLSDFIQALKLIKRFF